jgi:tetratricopeptide (TPR) repeat protein
MKEDRMCRKTQPFSKGRLNSEKDSSLAHRHLAVMRQPLSFFFLCLALLRLPSVAQEVNAEAQALFRQGVEAFFAAKPKESVAAFDKLIALEPALKPQLWQRGLSLYLAGEYAAGREQFEVHQTVNGHDVENAAWHFLCVARSAGLDAARQVLIPIEGDTRVPMKEVHDLFAGKGSVQEVLKAAETGEGEARQNQRCYAHLYLGLYFEALEDQTKAKEHLRKAAYDFRMDHYMGRCAQVHVKVRGW